MNSTEILADNVRRLMDSRGWKQTALADRAGISQKAVSNILSAKSNVTLDTLDRLAAVFGVSGHWLCIPIEDWPKTAA